MKLCSISAVISKSAITPSCKGLMAIIEPGVRPIIAFASLPVASTRRDLTSTATTDGSLIKILPFLSQISVFSVPRSMPISFVSIIYNSLTFKTNAAAFGAVNFNYKYYILNKIISQYQNLKLTKFSTNNLPFRSKRKKCVKFALNAKKQAALTAKKVLQRLPLV